MATGLIKPQPWAISPGLVDRQWQHLWGNCIMAVPLWEAQGTPKVYGRVANRSDTVLESVPQWVMSEVGPVLEWPDTNTTTDNGLILGDVPYKGLNKNNDFTFALAFKWFGSTGDQRALLYQRNNSGVSWGLRVRVADTSSPAGVEVAASQGGYNLLGTTAAKVVQNDWMLFVMRQVDGATSPYYWLANLSNPDTISEGSINDTNPWDAWSDNAYPVELGTGGPNDANRGQIGGFWLWYDEPWRTQNMEAFIRDPWGMFRRDATFPFETTGLDLVKVQSEQVDLTENDERASDSVVTQAETVGVTEAEVRNLELVRAQAETEGIVDAEIVVRELVVQKSETEGITESDGKSIGLTVTEDETGLGVTENIVRATGKTTIQTENAVGVTESTERNLDKVKVVGIDQVGITDDDVKVRGIVVVEDD